MRAAALAPRPQGQAEGDLEQPAGHRLRVADRAGLPGQHQEGGLEGVLGVLVVVQHAAADAQHHRAVAAR